MNAQVATGHDDVEVAHESLIRPQPRPRGLLEKERTTLLAKSLSGPRLLLPLLAPRLRLA